MAGENDERRLRFSRSFELYKRKHKYYMFVCEIVQKPLGFMVPNTLTGCRKTSIYLLHNIVSSHSHYH